MTVAYNYSSVSGEMQLTADVTAGAGSITVNSTVGLPSVPFKVAVDYGQATEEIVKVTAVSGNILTCTRGWDGTTGQAHSIASKVRHVATAEDHRLSRQHEDATAAHGATSALVGKDDPVVLTNKDLTSSSNAFPTSLVTLAGSQPLTNKDLRSSTNQFPTSLVTLAGNQTLTGKNLADASNVFPSSLATLTGAQAVTNKDLTSRTNTFPKTLFPATPPASSTLVTTSAVIIAVITLTVGKWKVHGEGYFDLALAGAPKKYGVRIVDQFATNLQVLQTSAGATTASSAVSIETFVEVTSGTRGVSLQVYALNSDTGSQGFVNPLFYAEPVNY